MVISVCVGNGRRVDGGVDTPLVILFVLLNRQCAFFHRVDQILLASLKFPDCGQQLRLLPPVLFHNLHQLLILLFDPPVLLAVEIDQFVLVLIVAVGLL